MQTMSDVGRGAALRSIALMAEGSLSEFEEVVAADAANHEADIEPPECRVEGPQGFHATALWLRSAFADLRHDIKHVAADGDLVVVDVTMSGRHVGDFVVYDGEGHVDAAWAPTGKTFAVRQTHWLRVDGDLVTEHWAVRDDLGQGQQLGWVPPSPAYLLRCARAKRRAIRSGAGHRRG